jgi:diaminohydroxyphosphoribosylaminopyrimidine deaminase/5-amino-6-(5-phosphoribosylamino)uracil reductase
MAALAEVAAMRRAIAVAAAGTGGTSPGPPEGCVLLGPDGDPLAEGYRERDGGPHAVAQALAAAGTPPGGTVAVVTLEPCAAGPSCTQALIGAGIRRVVIALTSAGGGAGLLRAAGVDVTTGLLAAEARLVLGDWLRTRQTRRPVIVWPYQIAGHGIAAVPGGHDYARQLRLTADAVLRADGRVTEGVPGAHGPDALDLSQVPAGPQASPAQIAAAAYRGGVRRLLLAGGLETAGPFLAAGLIDQVQAYLPHGKGSRKPSGTLPWPLLPPGFAITAVTRLAGFVRVDARPEPPARRRKPRA